MYFDFRGGHEALFQDARLRHDCREGCFCVDDENQYLAEDLKEAARRKGMAAVRGAPGNEVPIPQGFPMPQLPPRVRLFPQVPRFPLFPKMPPLPRFPRFPPDRPRMPRVKPFIRPLSRPVRLPREFGSGGQPPQRREPPASKNFVPF